jgi:hypothetical protein
MNSMVDFKIELKQIHDFENLRSYGYNRLASFDMYAVPAIASATIINTTNYGNGLDISGNDTGNDLNVLQMIGHLARGCRLILTQIRDGTDAARFDIAATTRSGLRSFAEEWIKGFLRLKGTETPPKAWLVNGDSGNLTALSTDRSNRTHASETGSEDYFRGWGYWMGLSAPQPPNVSTFLTSGSPIMKMACFGALKDAIIAAPLIPLAVIQTEIGNIQLGRKLQLIPAEFDVIPANEVDDVWLYTRTGRNPSTNMETNTGESPDNLANYVHEDFDYLPQTGLINILRKRAKRWMVPGPTLEMARQFFGYASSDYDFPTQFRVRMHIGDEQDSDKKRVGYGLLWAMWWLDEFFGAEDGLYTLYQQVLNNEHWQYRKFKEIHDSLFVPFSLSMLKGFMNSSYFTPAKWAFRMEDATADRGQYNNMRRFQTTNPVCAAPVTASDLVSALYATGGWDLDQIGAELFYELFFKQGTDGAAGGAILLDMRSSLWGEHYYTRKDQVINYVGPETGQVNRRIGADPAYDGNLLDQIGLSIVDLSGALTQRDIPSRLPSKKFPLPSVIEDFYKMDVTVAIAEILTGRLRGALGVVSAGESQSKNTNENEPGSEEADED